MSQQPGSSNNPSTGHTLPGGGGDSTFIGFAEPVPAVDPVTGLPIPGQFVPHLYMLTIGSQGGATGNGTGALASDTLDDGVHNITARVQIIEPSASTNPIKTAFGPRSQSLQITIDTVAPAVMFGFGPGGGGEDGGVSQGECGGTVWNQSHRESDLGFSKFRLRPGQLSVLRVSWGGLKQVLMGAVFLIGKTARVNTFVNTRLANCTI